MAVDPVRSSRRLAWRWRTGGAHRCRNISWPSSSPTARLWFIYVLPLFFLFTRLVKRLPVWFRLCLGGVLEIMPVHTGWVIFDEFCARYVYFFVGYAFAQNVFHLAIWMRTYRKVGDRVSRWWAVVNGVLVFTPAPEMPLAGLIPNDGRGDGRDRRARRTALHLAPARALRAVAVVAVASLVAAKDCAGWLSWLGAHSIVVLSRLLPARWR